MEDEIEGLVTSAVSVGMTFAVYGLGGSMLFQSIWLGIALAIATSVCHLTRYGSGIVLVSGAIIVLILGFPNYIRDKARRVC